MIVYRVQPADLSQRADWLLANRTHDISRTDINRLARAGKLTFERQVIKGSYRPKRLGDLRLDYDQSQVPVLAPVSLKVIYEDEALIVVNKPSGLLSHSRSQRYQEPSVASFFADLGIRVGHRQRPGIVHRLDKDTSGLLLGAKTEVALKRLQAQFKARTVSKQYLAVAKLADIPNQGLIDKPVHRQARQANKFCLHPNGRPALTRFEMDWRGRSALAVKLMPLTGRTHQLRLHLASLGAPIIGDRLYGGPSAPRLLLHATKLGLRHPGTNQDLSFTSQPPTIFEEFRQ